jgi:hypothetical protein
MARWRILLWCRRWLQPPIQPGRDHAPTHQCVVAMFLTRIWAVGLVNGSMKLAGVSRAAQR